MYRMPDEPPGGAGGSTAYSLICSLMKPVAPVLPKNSDLAENKIIIFTVFDQFHRHMKTFFDSCGMKTCIINGGLSATARTKAINDFKASDEHILIFSNVGSPGLNLMFCSEHLTSRGKLEWCSRPINHRSHSPPRADSADLRVPDDGQVYD
ncbi:hypothetical protein B0H14DRAFT_2578883 [Mycena olivaceomarginata]|nr:hypothetical protein B0H14DRAFT_2578883 [Mycena olivaceomarginata]